MCVSRPRTCESPSSHAPPATGDATANTSLTSTLKEWHRSEAVVGESPVSDECASTCSTDDNDGHVNTNLKGAEDIPVKTATNRDRHYVHHDYHDHAQDSTNGHWSVMDDMTALFPIKLHCVLSNADSNGMDHIISWAPHGRCFKIHKPKEFLKNIANRYFHQSKITSFQRQLNLYGFSRLTRGPDSGSYYHEYFLRGKAALARSIVRVKIKGTFIKAASSPDQEPNFYALPPMTSSTHCSDTVKGSATPAVGANSEANMATSASFAPLDAMYSTFDDMVAPSVSLDDDEPSVGDFSQLPDDSVTDCNLADTWWFDFMEEEGAVY